MDDLTGEWLPAELVRQAKVEELTEMYRKGGGVWTEVPTTRCYIKTNVDPTSVRWVVTNKGDGTNPAVRARLVARHIEATYGGKDGLYELFTAMPPFELMKLLLVRAVQGPCPLLGAEKVKAHGEKKMIVY